MVGLWPGQKLSYPDLKAAETKLAESGFFKVDAASDIRPTVQALDGPGPSVDILIKVEDLPPDPLICVGTAVLLVTLAIAAMLISAVLYRRRFRRLRANSSPQLN